MKNRRMKETRRQETQKFQREAGNSFHPRGLARHVAHKQMERYGGTGLNKVVPGGTQSPFATRWRDMAESIVG